MSGANKADRNNAHSYANYILIKNLSKIIFNSDYESDYTKWKTVSAKKINEAAIKLYEMIEDRLKKDNETSEII